MIPVGQRKLIELAITYINKGWASEAISSLEAVLRGDDSVKAPEPKLNSKTILIADNNDGKVAEITAEFLELAGYKTISFTNDTAALDYFRRKSDEIDLVITNARKVPVPLMTYLEQLKIVKPDVKILISSGDQSAKVDGHDFILKPFNEEIVEKVNSILQ